MKLFRIAAIGFLIGTSISPTVARGFVRQNGSTKAGRHSRIANGDCGFHGSAGEHCARPKTHLTKHVSPQRFLEKVEQKARMVNARQALNRSAECKSFAGSYCVDVKNGALYRGVFLY